MDRFGSMTIPQLKTELKARGAKLSGRKVDLVERLEAYERNANFGHAEPEEGFNMTVPDTDSYRDVNADSQIPEVMEQHVQNFVARFGTQLSKKIRQLYDEKFIHFVRFADSSHGKVFIKSRCQAEMKKNVVYTVDVLLDKDCVVVESQCQCGSGMGPEAHCKHVVLTLFGLSNHKQGMLTKETCTQILQTFHQCKPYKGSPLQTKALSLRKSDSLSNLADFDPRPSHLRQCEGYPHHFRSMVLNSRTENMPIKQLYPPANISIMVQDHDYFKGDPEENFLQSIGVSNIAQTEQADVEKKTQGQSTNKLWKLERAKRMQASNFGRICKATDRTNKDKLASSLTAVAKKVKAAPLDHGIKYEATAISQYEQMQQVKVQSSGIRVSGDRPYLACSPDGLVGDDIIIEVKCPYTASQKPINPVTVPYLYTAGPGGQLQLKRDHDYYYQIMGNLYCTGRRACDFVVYTFKDVKIIRIYRDESFLTGMLAKLTGFYVQHFRRAVLNRFLYKNTHLCTIHGQGGKKCQIY